MTGLLPKVSGDVSSFASLDTKIQKMNEILVDTRASMLPQRDKPLRKPKLKVWTPAIKRAVGEKKKAFWLWKCADHPDDVERLVINKKVTTQNLRRLCRLESAKQREEKRQEILDTKLEDSGLFHRLINRQRGGQRQCVNELHVD